VARFISLDSDQRASRKILTGARERLELARRRATAAWSGILRWDADGFFSTPEVVEAVLDNSVASPAELMRIASWTHEPDELAPFVTEVAEEAGRAREAIPPASAATTCSGVTFGAGVPISRRSAGRGCGSTSMTASRENEPQQKKQKKQK